MLKKHCKWIRLHLQEGTAAVREKQHCWGDVPKNRKERGRTKSLLPHPDPLMSLLTEPNIEAAGKAEIWFVQSPSPCSTEIQSYKRMGLELRGNNLRTGPGRTPMKRYLLKCGTCELENEGK